MSNLINALDVFKRRNSIDEAQLFYDWNGWDDKSASLLFHWFHVDLKYALGHETETAVRRVIQRILSWGGIKKTDDDTMNSFIGILKAFEKNKQWRSPKNDNVIVSQQHPIGSQEQTPLPSWTKILAAYDPCRYWIYDARVAVALRIVCPENKWFLPPSSATYNDTVRALIDYLDRKKQLSQRDSYDKYLSLLKKTLSPVKYERALFMLVNSIPLNIQNGFKYIDLIMNNGKDIHVRIPQD